MNGELGWGDEQGGLTGWGDQRVGGTGRCAPRPPARHPTRSQLLSSPPTPPHSSSPHPVSDTQLPGLPPVNPPRNAHAPAATATTPTCRPAALRQTPCSRGSWRRRTDPPTAGTSREDVDVGVDEAQATIPIQRIPPDPIQNSRSVGPSPSALPWPPPQRRASAHAATRRPRTSSSYRSVRSCAREKDRFEFESLSESPAKVAPRVGPPSVVSIENTACSSKRWETRACAVRLQACHEPTRCRRAACRAIRRSSASKSSQLAARARARRPPASASSASSASRV